MTVLNLVVNILIVALLAATIGYCWLLNRRIKVLQDSKSELAQLLKYFDESTQRASDSIIALQSASKKIGETIQTRIDKANYLADDLTFMIEKGGKLADQLEANFAVNRARTRVMNEPPAAEPEEAPIQAPVEKPPLTFMPLPDAAARAEKNSTLREKASTSLESVLEKIAGRSKTALTALPETPAEPEKQARSKAEQELLQMLKGGMKG